MKSNENHSRFQKKRNTHWLIRRSYFECDFKMQYKSFPKKRYDANFDLGSNSKTCYCESLRVGIERIEETF